MAGETSEAAASTTAPEDKNNTLRQFYNDSPSRSSGNLKEQVGLLLWHLQGPLTYREHKKGWSLFEVLLSARYGRGSQ